MKLGLTKRMIGAWVKNFTPAIMMSFGKDSMVMLHICRSLGLKLPIIYHRAPWFPEKNRFADNQIYSLGLEVHDWPPQATGIKDNGKVLEVGCTYQVSPKSSMSMCYNTVHPKAGEKFICSRYDMLGRPTCQNYSHPWDLLMIGHKSSDVDNFEGPFPLTTYTFKDSDAPTMAFPLRDWNDNDVWDYIEEHKVSVQKNRYDVANRKNFESKAFNNDYVTACTLCIDKKNPDKVNCPLYGKIDNVSNTIPSLVTKFAYNAATA